MNLIFEPDPVDIDRRLRDEDALDVLVIDDPRMPTATHLETSGPYDVARILQRGRPDIVYVPNATTHARVQVAIGLAACDVRVVVGASREAFLALADDPALRDKLWT